MTDFNELCQDLSTRRLAGLLECVRAETSFFCDVLFRDTLTFDTETIQWDRVYEDDTMAPFVCPCVQAPNIGGGRSWDSVLFAPAYVKYKTTINCCEALPRGPGEACWGDLTAKERFEAHVARELARHDKALTLREEWMAAKAIVDGHYTVEGEQYKAAKVDFKRESCLTWSLKGDQVWGKGSCDALGSLQSAYDKVFCESNAQITDVLMSPATCLKFKQSDDVKTDCCTGSNPFLDTSGALADLTPRTDMNVAGARVEFIIGGVRFWCVNAYHTVCHADGSKTKENYIPDGKVIGLALGQDCGIQPIKLYGAIQDCGSLVAERRYTKTWEQPDPSAFFIMTQSAPLPVLLNPNASFCMTVCPTK